MKRFRTFILDEIFFKFPFPFEALRGLFEGSSRAFVGGAVEASSKSHISHIIITYHDFELARTAPSAGALGEPSESSRREKGVPRVSPERKKNKYYCNVEIFQAFHYWEARAPSTYYLHGEPPMRQPRQPMSGLFCFPSFGTAIFFTRDHSRSYEHLIGRWHGQERNRSLGLVILELATSN